MPKYEGYALTAAGQTRFKNGFLLQPFKHPNINGSHKEVYEYRIYSGSQRTLGVIISENGSEGVIKFRAGRLNYNFPRNKYEQWFNKKVIYDPTSEEGVTKLKQEWKAAIEDWADPQRVA